MLKFLKAFPAPPADNRPYPVPEGFQRLSFGKLAFIYQPGGYTARCTAAPDYLKSLKRIRRLDQDNVTVWKDKQGRRLVCFCRTLPVFDSGDREWDS